MSSESLSAPPSRLPDVKTTIFTTMSALASECNAVNLGQGFPDFPCDDKLVAAVGRAMQDGHNQYAPMAGVLRLREQIAHKTAGLYGQHYNTEHEVTVTAGATQALFTAIACCCHPGDEIIVLDPCYDSYDPAIRLAGGHPVHVPLTTPGFHPDFDRIAAAMTPRTRALILNTPHNPTGTIWSRQDMQQLQELVADSSIILISDEVYEHMVYAPARHESVARYPELSRRAFIISSFGKTFHVTGWKTGYVLAPSPLMHEFRKVHQFNVFCVNTPVQYGLAEYMRDPSSYMDLAAFYERKRKLFVAGIEQTPFKPLPCDGSYFQLVSYADIGSAERQLSDLDFCTWLTREPGVAAIPVSAFYPDGRDQKLIRFCFAKRDSTLQEALQRLHTI